MSQPPIRTGVLGSSDELVLYPRFRHPDTEHDVRQILGRTFRNGSFNARAFCLFRLKVRSPLAKALHVGVPDAGADRGERSSDVLPLWLGYSRSDWDRPGNQSD